MPLWRTPSREEATAILARCRAVTDSLISPLSAAQLTLPTALGDETWSVKDLLGHLTAWERRSLQVMGVAQRDADEPSFSGADDYNAHHLSRTRAMSLDDVQREYADVRTTLVSTIGDLDDEQWRRKIDVGGKKSALALVVAKLLTGAKYGYCAHDLAHLADLRTAVQQLQA